MKKNFSKIIFWLLILLIIVFFAYRFKGKFLAGTVNGQPIFRFQLTNRLYSQYGRQVLEDLIVEKLIVQEAKKKGVTVLPQDVDQGIQKIKGQLGGQTDLESLLSLQGIKKADFENQLKIQILVRKLLEREINLSDEEVANFVKENRKTMVATTQAELEAEAKERLTNQMINSRLNSWISELIQKAKIVKFLP